MSALEGNLQRVLTDQGYVVDAELFRSKLLDAMEAAGCAGLAATFCTGACPAQTLAGVGAVVLVLPDDLHHLAFTVDVDGEREGVWLVQVVRPTVTGR